MESIYLMGMDVWSKPSDDKASYLNICRESTKYKSGDWYLMSVGNEPVCSALTFHLDVGDTKTRVLGIGSLATASLHRGKGYGSRMIKEIVDGFSVVCGYNLFVLYSDIGVDFYRRFGFKPIGCGRDPEDDCVCMLLNKGYSDVDLKSIYNVLVNGYF